MTPSTILGSVLLASASECGSLEALALEMGVSRQALANVIHGGTPSAKTLLAIMQAMPALTPDDIRVMMATPDTGEPWQPDHAAGGKARQGSLCAECGERISRDAALKRWAEQRERASEGQMTIMEASA